MTPSGGMFGRFGGPFWHQKSIKVRSLILACKKGRILLAPRSFWSLFGFILGSFSSPKLMKNRIEFRRRFREGFWEPPGTLRGQKAGFSLEGCSKSKVDLLAPECLRGRLWRPKGSQNGAQKRPKINKNTRSEFGGQKGRQNR